MRPLYAIPRNRQGSPFDYKSDRTIIDRSGGSLRRCLGRLGCSETAQDRNKEHRFQIPSIMCNRKKYAGVVLTRARAFLLRRNACLGIRKVEALNLVCTGGGAEIGLRNALVHSESNLCQGQLWLLLFPHTPRRWPQSFHQLY